MKDQSLYFGLSHVDIPVRDVSAALRLYRDVLGFDLLKEGEGWADLDAHTAKVRLLESKTLERPATVRVQSRDVEAGLKQLVASGAVLLYEASRTEQLTIEGSVRDGDGNTVTVWRELSEDEYGFDPELPMELTWDADAEALLKSLLKAVPALFRGLARRKVVKEAEARAHKTRSIDRDLAIRSFISAQSPPNRARLREPLKKHGADPDAYRDEFDS